MIRFLALYGTIDKMSQVDVVQCSSRAFVGCHDRSMFIGEKISRRRRRFCENIRRHELVIEILEESGDGFGEGIGR